jgi:hypothetical protein
MEVNRRAKKADILLRKAELLASSFDPRPCDEKTAGELKRPVAPILPFMTGITPDPDGLEGVLG